MTIPTVPGRLRPFAATLGVTRPVEGKKHDTTTSKWDEVTPSKTSRDGVVDDDSHTDTHTDS